MRAVSILATASLLVLVATQARAQSSVTIDWDEWGVAHVQAADLESGAYGLGWSQMEARGGSVAMAYLVSRGEASACLGESWVASDTRIREMGVPARSEAWVTAQEPETKSMFAGFVRGMNAWLDRHPQSEGPMACLGQVRDSDPLAFLQVSLHVAVVAFNADSLVGDWKESRGSNAYAVAPQRTADGRTLLLINPHSGWSAPFLTYETHLITPDLNIYGQTFPGLPLPFAGFTDDHGWAFTFNDIDGVDLYELTLADDGYRFGNDVLPFDRRSDRIQVRLASGELESRTVDVRESVHGPVISEVDGRALAVRIAGLDRPGLYTQLLAMWRADDLDAFRTALAQQQIPITNTVYADADGQILYVFNGLSPIRDRGDRAFWAGVVDGSDPTLVSDGYLPFDAMPQVANPPGGFVQNANDGPSGSTWPGMIAATDIDPRLTDNRRTPRGRRSLRQMEATDGLTLDGLDRLRASSTMDAAERARGPLAAAAMASNDAELRRLGAILGAWDGSTTPESRGSVLFADWAYRMDRADVDLTNAPIDTVSPLVTEAPLADVARALEQLRASGTQIERLFGTADVAWGQVYRIRYAGLDLPSPVGRDELGAFNAGHYQRISEAGPDQGRFILTDASHFISEIAFGPDGPEARGLLTYGNHDDPAAPDVRRQLEMFSRSEVRAMHFHTEDVNQASIRREILDASDDQAASGSVRPDQ